VPETEGDLCECAVLMYMAYYVQSVCFFLL
jgi:hypothetical protein